MVSAWVDKEGRQVGILIFMTIRTDSYRLMDGCWWRSKLHIQIKFYLIVEKWEIKPLKIEIKFSTCSMKQAVVNIMSRPMRTAFSPLVAINWCASWRTKSPTHHQRRYTELNSKGSCAKEEKLWMEKSWRRNNHCFHFPQHSWHDIFLL